MTVLTVNTEQKGISTNAFDAEVESTPREVPPKSYIGEYDELLKFLLNNENALKNLIQTAKKEPELGQIETLLGM